MTDAKRWVTPWEYELPDGSRYDRQGEMTQGPRETRRELVLGPRTARSEQEPRGNDNA